MCANVCAMFHSGLVVVPHTTLATAASDADALKNEPPVTIVPVPEEQ